MTNFKKGDKVLWGPLEISKVGRSCAYFVVRDHAEGEQHPTTREQAVLLTNLESHPAVPVAALLEELSKLWAMVNEAEQETFTSTASQALLHDATLYRAAREAAQEGDTRKVIGETEHGDLVYALDDWRTEEPPEIEDVFQPAKYTTTELTEIANACYDDMHRRVRDEL